MKLILGDCIEEMSKLPDKSIDMCLTDPPYGATYCKWDTVIPFEPMWKELKRIVKDNGAICLFGRNPYTANLIMSNVKYYRYDWVWKKQRGTGHLNAKIMPLQSSEYISVFGFNKLKYYPQGLKRGVFKNDRPKKNRNENELYRKEKNFGMSQKGSYPVNVLEFNKIAPQKTKHPTQKPVALLEYLIKTYTLESETVLDFTMGSGSTGVACKNLNRKFIGIEKEPKYFEIAKKRLDETN